jgi:C_GCAxxG_C_C family probable redox protein
MSIYLDKAKAFREDPDVHYNCAQAVLVPFAPAFGMTEDQEYRLAANFGSGMKMAATCGAITGGLMALGLAGVDDGATVNSYYAKLRGNHQGFLDCADLLRINKEQGKPKKPHCDDMVYECTALVEEILREKGIIS